jgi:hypothetical protein
MTPILPAILSKLRWRFPSGIQSLNHGRILLLRGHEQSGDGNAPCVAFWAIKPSVGQIVRAPPNVESVTYVFSTPSLISSPTSGTNLSHSFQSTSDPAH